MSEDFTQRATCECYYKFENSGDLGEDEQNQIDLTNSVSPVTQSATIPSGTYANPTAQNSANFVAASSQYLTASHADSTEIDDISAITFLAWAKLDILTGFHFIYSKGYSGHAFTAQTTYMRSYWSSNSNSPSISNSTGVWYFWAATYSQDSDAMRVYQGTEEGQVAQIGSDATVVDQTAATAQEFNIGCWEDQSLYFDGLITEFAIFSEELSLAELQEIQADGMEGTPVVEAPTPVLSKDGIHSLVFGGQVISG